MYYLSIMIIGEHWSAKKVLKISHFPWKSATLYLLPKNRGRLKEISLPFTSVFKSNPKHLLLAFESFGVLAILFQIVLFCSLNRLIYMVWQVFKSMHVAIFANLFFIAIFFSMNKVFYKATYLGKVSVITSYGFIKNKVRNNI